MTFVDGGIYKIMHQRKGSFTLKVDRQDKEWLYGSVWQGKADALMSYNQKFEGDEITVRKIFIYYCELVSVKTDA